MTSDSPAVGLIAQLEEHCIGFAEVRVRSCLNFSGNFSFSHPGQRFPLSLCGPNSISRANAHVVYGLKHQHFTLHSITQFVQNFSGLPRYNKGSLKKTAGLTHFKLLFNPLFRFMTFMYQHHTYRFSNVRRAILPMVTLFSYFFIC